MGALHNVIMKIRLYCRHPHIFKRWLTLQSLIHHRVYLLSQLVSHHNFARDGRKSERGMTSTPHPQAGLNLPS